MLGSQEVLFDSGGNSGDTHTAYLSNSVCKGNIKEVEIDSCVESEGQGVGVFVTQSVRMTSGDWLK